MGNLDDSLKLNMWYDSDDGRFSFQGFWYSQKQFNPDNDKIDVNVRLSDDQNKYIGTFATKNYLREYQDKWRNSKYYVPTVDIPHEKRLMLIERLDTVSIEKAIITLLDNESFFKHFQRVIE